MHLVPDGLHLRRVAAGADDEEVRIDADRPHVEDHDVVRQLVLGNAGNPAGLFERVQLLSAYPARGAYNPRHSISAAMAGGTRLTIGAPSAASLRTSLDEIG